MNDIEQARELLAAAMEPEQRRYFESGRNVDITETQALQAISVALRTHLDDAKGFA